VKAMPLYAEPMDVASPEGCYFYTTIDIPGFGLMSGDWDLRDGIEDYLGREEFAGKRVLEIGPASGFVTFEMERRGADVVSVELAESVGWDFAPYPEDILKPHRERAACRRAPLNKSYWLAHRTYGSKAKVHYGSAYDLPKELGRFDIAIIADVLLHTRAPLQIIEECAKFADTLIVTDLRYDDIDAMPVMRLVPDADNHDWSSRSWWHLSSKLISQWLGVLGFREVRVLRHVQMFRGNPGQHFTVVATRPVRR